MLRILTKCVIKQAYVTDCKLSYSGSIGLDKLILDKANISAGEIVQIFNLSNKASFETYTIAEKKGSRKVVLYGPAAKLGCKGDKLYIISYHIVDEKQAKNLPYHIISLKNNLPV